MLRRTSVRLRATFDAADSAASVGSADTGQPAIVAQGTWGRSSGKAYSVSDADGDTVNWDAGVANGILTATMRAGSPRISELVFRGTDAANCLLLRPGPAVMRLYTIMGGSFAEVASGSALGSDDTSRAYHIEMAGTAVRVYMNGVFCLSYAPTALPLVTGTRVGLRLEKTGTPTLPATWDDLKVVKA